MVICVYFKFHEIPFSGNLGMANLIFKGFSSYTTVASPTKTDTHQCIIVIYFYFQFHVVT